MAAARPSSALPRAQEVPRLLDARTRWPASFGDDSSYTPHQAGGIQGGRRGVPAELRSAGRARRSVSVRDARRGRSKRDYKIKGAECMIPASTRASFI